MNVDQAAGAYACMRRNHGYDFIDAERGRSIRGVGYCTKVRFRNLNDKSFCYGTVIRNTNKNRVPMKPYPYEEDLECYIMERGLAVHH